jgi:transcriptional regulator with XRE-family HTH domain
MKVKEKQLAILWRKKGMAMGDIAKRLGVAKSSVSYWVRDVKLTSAQIKKLKANSHASVVIEKRRQARLKNTDKRRAEVRRKALLLADELKNQPLWWFGVTMYWGEGNKTQQARIANSDPDVIRLMLRFFREVCEIPEQKLHGHVHTFDNTNVSKTEEYWSDISGIPVDKFYKTHVKKSIASKNKRRTLPNGTFQVYVHDTDFFFTLLAWIEFLKSYKYKKAETSFIYLKKIFNT